MLSNSVSATATATATLLDDSPLTFYFRQTFQLDDLAAVSESIAGINADDGAIIYINGIEVARDNMPAGAVTPLTPASSSRWGGANEGIIRDFDLPVSALVAGTNVIAVEVHNLSSPGRLALHLSGHGVSPPGEISGFADRPGSVADVEFRPQAKSPVSPTAPEALLTWSFAPRRNLRFRRRRTRGPYKT